MLKQERIREIEGRAMDILLAVFSDEEEFKLPINIQKITKTLELNLKEGVFENEEVVGFYNKEEKTIYISKDDAYTRKTFTIAHEVGHYVLHKEKDREVFYRRDLILLDTENRIEEQEANCFAANLLMPKGTLLRYLKITKNTEILAQEFGVSSSAMALRLKTLHLVEA